MQRTKTAAAALPPDANQITLFLSPCLLLRRRKQW